MEMKHVGLVELLQGKKASSFVCELEWKKLNCGMEKNRIFLSAFCQDAEILKMFKLMLYRNCFHKSINFD